MASFKTLIVYFVLLVSVNSSSFNAQENQNLVFYWGQGSAGDQQSLGYYCQQNVGDVFIISFLNEFSTGIPTLNIVGYNEMFPGTQLLHCPSIGDDIKACQSMGKMVFLSLGGASGTYGFSDGSNFAQTLWDLFGGGSSETRPFGDAIVDGFDLDIENSIPTGYVALVNTLRTQYFSNVENKKQYYISAAPQCPYPDANVGDVLSQSEVDFAWIQFYYNYCAIDQQFNWDTWLSFANNVSPNKNIKLYVGLPGSSSAAGTGYIADPQSNIQNISSNKQFGGIMIWDASQAFIGEEVQHMPRRYSICLVRAPILTVWRTILLESTTIKARQFLQPCKLKPPLGHVP